MSWDEYDDVQVREYMNRVELPEFLKANMEDGDRWDGKLDGRILSIWDLSWYEE